MTSDTNSNEAASGSFVALLILIFIVLKVTSVEPVASWSWWWVLSPLWIPAAIVLVLLACWLIEAAIVGAVSISWAWAWSSWRKRMAKFEDAP